MVDKSLSFGQQNFFFVESNETDGTYDYVGYQNKKGATLIARFTKDGLKGKYCIKTGNFDTVFAARATFTYAVPASLEDPTV